MTVRVSKVIDIASMSAIRDENALRRINVIRELNTHGNLYKALLSPKSRKFDLRAQPIGPNPPESQYVD